MVKDTRLVGTVFVPQYTPSVSVDHIEALDELRPIPSPVGGIEALASHVVYPDLAIRAGIQGRVTVRFIVTETGTTDSATVMMGLGAGCDEQAIEAIKKSTFTPGGKSGKPAKAAMSVRFRFTLEKK